MKKKILFVTNTIQMLSGAAKIFRFVSSEMSNCGYEVEALIILDDSIEETIENVPVSTLGIKTFPKGIWRLRTFSVLRREIRKSNPDIVCTFVQDACFLVRVATLGLPILTISCDRGDPSWGGKSLWKPITKWTYRQSDICVFQLPEVRDYFGSKNLKKSYVIPNPFVPMEEPDRSFVNKTIVSAGRFTDQKGFDVLIKAFDIVRKRFPEYKLIIWGDGDLREEYQSLIDKLQLKDSVELPGYIRNVSSAIKHEGIFVLSSRYEGIPNALIEAMSMGLPCVSTDCSPGGARFLASNETRAIIVPVDCSELLANAICKVIEDKNLAKSLSSNALQVRKEYEPAIILNLWRKVFDSIVE